MTLSTYDIAKQSGIWQHFAGACPDLISLSFLWVKNGQVVNFNLGIEFLGIDFQIGIMFNFFGLMLFPLIRMIQLVSLTFGLGLGNQDIELLKASLGAQLVGDFAIVV